MKGLEVALLVVLGRVKSRPLIWTRVFIPLEVRYCSMFQTNRNELYEEGVFNECMQVIGLGCSTVRYDTLDSVGSLPRKPRPIRFVLEREINAAQ